MPHNFNIRLCLQVKHLRYSAGVMPTFAAKQASEGTRIPRSRPRTPQLRSEARRSRADDWILRGAASARIHRRHACRTHESSFERAFGKTAQVHIAAAGASRCHGWHLGISPIPNFP